MKTTKLGSVVLIAMLLLSGLPMVFADRGRGGGDDTLRVELESETEVDDDVDDDDDVEVESETEVESENRGEGRDNLGLNLKTRLRVGTEEIREEIRDLREEIKERREELREKIETEARLRAELRSEVRSCRGKGTSDCQEVRSEFKGHAMEELEARTDHLIALLERLQDRVEESDLENKAEISADLQAQIDAAAALKARIEAFDENTSPEDMQAAAKELRELGMEYKARARIYAFLVVNAGLNGILERAEHLETKLNRTLMKLEERGFNTTEADAEVDVFAEHIAEARTKHAEAKAKFEAALTADTEAERQTLMREGRMKLDEAREHLREAHESLKEIVRLIRGINEGSATLEAELEAEGEVE